MKLVLIGIPGAGKSTQGNLLSKQLKIPYLSTGHIFREIAKEKTQLGRYVKEVLNSGHLMPDEKTLEIVHNYLSRSEYKNGYILDGFPRTLHQAKEFENNVDHVIYLEISDKESLWRLAHRKDESRDDDTITAIRKRIDIFHTHTQPVIDHYQKEKKLVMIDGVQSIEAVNEEILKNLGKQLIKNQVKSWEKKKKTIIAITGLHGSGKDEAGKFFAEKDIPVIHFGNIINEYVDEHHLEHTEEVHNKLRQKFRQQYGLEALARLSLAKIKQALEKSMIVVIVSLYSWEEYQLLQKEFPEVNIFILAIYADKHLRYKRASERTYRSGLVGEKRDIDELLYTNKGPTIAYSDFLVKNNFSLEEFRDKLEEVYRTVYFS